MGCVMSALLECIQAIYISECRYEGVPVKGCLLDCGGIKRFLYHCAL